MKTKTRFSLIFICACLVTLLGSFSLSYIISDSNIIDFSTCIGKKDFEIIEQYGEFDHTLESPVENAYYGGYIIRYETISTTYYMIHFVDNIATDINIYERI